MKGDILKKAMFLFRKILGSKKIEDIKQSHGCSGFVSMHLRPEVHRGVAGTDADKIQIPAFDGFTDFLNSKAFGSLQLVDQGLNIFPGDPALGQA